MISDSSMVLSGEAKLLSLQLVGLIVNGVVALLQLSLPHLENVILMIGSPLLTSTSGMAWPF